MNPFVTCSAFHQTPAHLPTYPTPIPIHNPIVPNHPLLFCGFAAKKVDGKNLQHDGITSSQIVDSAKFCVQIKLK